ncbi:MAG: 50S ribosomal protein L11 methyltransferase [Oscillospiraceae bacterium]|nr:50S ribosomal protein L11 methyltransferase [Oscillospiraceae bacterium]
MRYWECILDTPAAEIDARCDELASLGVGGFVVENEEDFRDFLENNRQYWDYVDQELENRYAGLSRLKFYLTDDEDGLAVLRAVRARYEGVRVSVVEDSDWENNWREYYKPIEVGERLVVVPEWEALPSGGRLPLWLDPGLTFGTGSHATTRMCLQALEEYAAPGKRVLDLGCGSGILGIGALVLGCDSCLGCDIDPKSPDVAMSNAALNRLGPDRIRIVAGDLLSDASLRRSFGTGYDIVLANIVSDVIIPLSAYVPGFIRPDGVFITSGIIEGRQEEVRAAVEKAGFRIVRHLSEDDWHCYVALPSIGA